MHATFLLQRAPTICRYVSKIAYISMYFRERTFFQSNSYLNRTYGIYVSKVRIIMINVHTDFAELILQKLSTNIPPDN